jgi:hypothetical protein
VIVSRNTRRAFPPRTAYPVRIRAVSDHRESKGFFPTPLAATLIDLSVSVANKRFTQNLTPLDATLTKNLGEGSQFCFSTFQPSNVQTCNDPRPNSFPHTFLANPHPLNPLLSHSYKNHRERGSRSQLCDLWTLRPADIATKLSIVFPDPYALFHFPYPATPVFATLTKTPGVYANSSHFGSPGILEWERRGQSNVPAPSEEVNS